MDKINTYKTDHCVAKLIVCLIYIIIGAISIETGNPYAALIPGTLVWFFGVNTTAYLIEEIMGHSHYHHKI